MKDVDDIEKALEGIDLSEIATVGRLAFLAIANCLKIDLNNIGFPEFMKIAGVSSYAFYEILKRAGTLHRAEMILDSCFIAIKEKLDTEKWT